MDCNILALVIPTVILLTIVLDGMVQPEIRHTAIKSDGPAVTMSAIQLERTLLEEAALQVIARHSVMDMQLEQVLLQ